jgi:hypothetical protein
MRLTYTPSRPQDRFVVDDVPLKAGESTDVTQERGEELCDRYPDTFTLGPEEEKPAVKGPGKTAAPPHPSAQSSPDTAPSNTTGDVNT